MKKLELWQPPKPSLVIVQQAFDVFASNLRTALLTGIRRNGISDGLLLRLNPEDLELRIMENDRQKLSIGPEAEISKVMRCKSKKCLGKKRRRRIEKEVPDTATAFALNAIDDPMLREYLAGELTGAFVDGFEDFRRLLREPVCYESMDLNREDIEELAERREREVLADLPILYERIVDADLML